MNTPEKFIGKPFTAIGNSKTFYFVGFGSHEGKLVVVGMYYDKSNGVTKLDRFDIRDVCIQGGIEYNNK